MVFNPTDNGFCVSDCLDKLDILHIRKPWIDFKYIRELGIPYLLIQNGTIV